MSIPKSRLDYLRVSNPFRELLVTELIEDVDLYRDMFSDNILVGEAITVFMPGNVVVLGPLGSGKTMLMNLIRLPVIAKLLQIEAFPEHLQDVLPYFGISMNLTRASFFNFGSRSVAKAMGWSPDPVLETSAAADYFSYFLLNEVIKGLTLCKAEENWRLRDWLGIDENSLFDGKIPRTIANWECWNGWLGECTDWESLLDNCQERIAFWRRFLNTDIDTIPGDIWEKKADVERVMHNLGNLIRALSNNQRLSLFVFIDQYEEAIKLNKTHGRELLRLINKLIKARDPVVFYRIGARTYDWGMDLRVSGSESKIEAQRDYSVVDLTRLLLRREDRLSYIYPPFAVDVARRRLRRLEINEITAQEFREIFGKWSAIEESDMYFKSKDTARATIRDVPSSVEDKIVTLCSGIEKGYALDMRLASAWALQQLRNRNKSEQQVLDELETYPWQTHKWWNKERKEIGLVQLASHSNSSRRYFGFETILSLSGGNISLFILLCSEIWDVAARLNIDPLEQPLDYKIQTRGIMEASRKWLERDRNEQHGAVRHTVIDRLGAAIAGSIRNDLALSNPGYTGFSVSEHLSSSTVEGQQILELLRGAVGYSMIEERKHKSKHRGDPVRLKYYLHPILSPMFDIPIKRVKEPYYTDVETVFSWLFGTDKIRFGSRSREKRSAKSSALIENRRLWDDQP